MTVELIPGANAALTATDIVVKVATGGAADVSSFRLYDGGKTRIDEDFIFYGQKINDDRTVEFLQNGNTTEFAVKLNLLNKDVQKIAFSATVDSGTVAALGFIKVSVNAGSETLISADVPVDNRSEKALILGELYLRNGQWKYRNVSQGFDGGLQPLAEHFGVEIANDPTPTPAPAPSPAPAINLSKVTLTKNSPSVSLTKRSGGYGLIKVNLNWTQKVKSGFFGSTNIDLDIGCFVRLKNGQKGVVQALGNAFGDYEQAPFVKLTGDDRTGQSSDGEWLHINGDQWAQLDEVLVYTFIYEGAVNWQEANASVTLHAPGQPPVETFLTEGNKKMGMCAIARLVNDNGNVKVERLNSYHNGHSELDKQYGWGFRWQRGSK
ncbi:TerD family protein [Gayadomonas joobiniege]|uniref:TerD family protein n=1 Tax=Gayadomonas joobiniege TaxID=1234606 RepID=UPI000363EE36|nr:TerD family protein [Gayadomonas joobiniege]